MDNKTLFQLVPTLHFVLNLMQFVKLRQVYTMSNRAYHTICVSPTSAIQDMLERNSMEDASLLHRRNSIPEMTVNIHVAEE